MSSNGYSNPDTEAALDAALEEQLAREKDKELAGQTATAGEVASARSTIASEEQPGYDELPQPKSKTVAWRGTDLEFDEVGDALTTFQKLREDDDTSDTELNDYIYTLFSRKCQHPGADEAYWRQFDAVRDDDEDGLVDLLLRVAGGDVPDEDESDAIETFRNE